ncbi:MAG: hypothetical protein K5660_00550, partial [Paludibacteraceae bacterium]|nr:hypothetical protein [Paludibacteraceae bacterium]
NLPLHTYLHASHRISSNLIQYTITISSPDSRHFYSIFLPGFPLSTLCYYYVISMWLVCY